MKAGLFFVALLPDEEIREELTRFKQYAAEHFHSARALRSPPHITLVPPFFWKEEKTARLLDALAGFAAGRPKIRLRLEGFDCFAPRVIFVKVALTGDLQDLQAGLSAHLLRVVHLVNPDKRPYHPHLTVAFKDLKRSVFPEAWDHFSKLDYRRDFVADHLTLLRHNGRVWEVFRDFPF